MIILGVALVSQSSVQVAGSAPLTRTVRDEAGAEVLGASVVLIEIARQLDRDSVTNEAGRFVFLNIPAVAYSTAVTKWASRPTLIDIRLAVDQQGRMEILLKVGAVTTSIDVSAKQDVLLETESNTIGTVVDSERVAELPLNGRNPLQLALLAAGANDSSNRIIQTISVTSTAPSSLEVISPPYQLPAQRDRRSRKRLD
ncbi:MAG TPA: carboxypeptidase-like regulatory domain-containing protein [Bryobacteraceae bacterium]|nr:carboxypeptidase-like regulatory domain-containing protein [Bryobacteraceae bacterium]